MPYGQSPWEQATPAMQGIGQSMGNVMMASQQGNLKRQQFLAQQALEQAYLQIARQNAQRQQMVGQSQMQMHSANAEAARQRAAMTMAQQGSAERLGDQVWRQNMPRPSSDINQPIPDMDPQMARIAGETARMMALHGKTVPLHNVPPGNMAFSPQGQMMAQGNMQMTPYQEQRLAIERQRLERPPNGLTPEQHQAKLLMDQYVQATAAQRNLGGQFNMNAGTPQYGQASNLVNQAASRVFGGQPQVPQGEGQPRVVRSKEERDALPPGTVYVGPDGIPATKQ